MNLGNSIFNDLISVFLSAIVVIASLTSLSMKPRNSFLYRFGRRLTFIVLSSALVSMVIVKLNYGLSSGQVFLLYIQELILSAAAVFSAIAGWKVCDLAAKWFEIKTIVFPVTLKDDYALTMELDEEDGDIAEGEMLNSGTEDGNEVSFTLVRELNGSELFVSSLESELPCNSPKNSVSSSEVISSVNRGDFADLVDPPAVSKFEKKPLLDIDRNTPYFRPRPHLCRGKRPRKVCNR